MDLVLEKNKKNNTIKLDDTFDINLGTDIDISDDMGMESSHSTKSDLKPQLKINNFFKTNNVSKPKLTVPMDDIDLLSNNKKYPIKSERRQDSNNSDSDSDSDSDPDSNSDSDDDHYNSSHRNSSHSNSHSSHSNSHSSSSHNGNNNFFSGIIKSDDDEHGDRNSSDNGHHEGEGEGEGNGYKEDGEGGYKTFEEIQNEKEKYLHRLIRLDRYGYKSKRRFTMASKLEDIIFEYKRLKREKNLNSSIKSYRKYTMMGVSGIEMTTKYIDIIPLELNGWSKQVHEELEEEQYDEIFEDLHDKYSDTFGNVAPELRLLGALGVSAFSFHLTKKFVTSATPDLGDILQKNPEILNSIKAAAMNDMSANANIGGNPMANMMMNGARERMQASSQGQRRSPRPREMNGPTGVDDILAELGNTPSSNRRPVQPEFNNPLSGDESSVRNVRLSSGSRRGRRKKTNKNSINIDL